MSNLPTLREAFFDFKRLLLLVRPYWPALMKTVVLAIVLGVVGMAPPYITKLLIDEVYPSENVRLLTIFAVGFLVIVVGSSLGKSLSSFFSSVVSTRLESATSVMFFNHVQHLEARFFDEHQVGELLSRFNDLNRALKSIRDFLDTIFVQGIYIFLVPPFLFLIEWKLALAAMLYLPLTIAVTAISGRVMRGHWKRTSEANADISAYYVETLTNIRTFKAMGLEHRIFSRARNLTERAMDFQLRTWGLSHFFGALNGVLRGGNSALLMWFGWTLILNKEMTLGDYIAFSSYIGYMYAPLAQFVNLLAEFQQSSVYLARMFEYLDHEPEQDPADSYSVPGPPQFRIQGGFQLRNLTFAYDRDHPVLQGVDLEIPAAKTTAIVGPSGSGKTTLLRLLIGMAKPSSGEVCVDGIPMSEMPIGDLRRQLSVVWQEVSLVGGTLRDNLTIGNEDVTAEEIERAVTICGLREVVDKLPQKYDTHLGEWGVRLSAGQRQRVALARAVLRDTPVILLDEATANVDAENESEILGAIFSHLKDKTIIFVTHRLPTARLAEQICVLDEGRLVGRGGHEELLATCEEYERMYNLKRASGNTRLRVVSED